MHLLGMSGSLRRGSFNAALLAAAAAELPPAVQFDLWHGLADVPPFREDHHEPPTAVIALRHEIAAADAVLIATPEYNGSVPGALKNALDWASRPYPDNSLRGKPVAVIGASTGLFGAVWAQADLRRILRTAGASVLDAELAVPSAHEAFAADGRLLDHRLAQTLHCIVGELVRSSLSEAA
jgi:chromate reductase